MKFALVTFANYSREIYSAMEEEKLYLTIITYYDTANIKSIEPIDYMNFSDICRKELPTPIFCG